MPITINGSGTVTGMSAGGLPDASVVAADLANPLDLSGHTVTLPSGTGGKILNVSQVLITSTATFNTNGGPYARFAAMDSTYTTTASNSKILVLFNFLLSVSGLNADKNVQVHRKIGSGSATQLLVNPSVLGSTQASYLGVFRYSSANAGAYRQVLTLLDDPGHTAGDVLTYEHHWITENSDPVRLNHSAISTSNNKYGTTVSTVVFLEVAS
mgnify:CR=1 FL=1